jgi:Methyltransferase domain
MSPAGAPAVTPLPAMERLSFALPEFSRVSWVSDEARDAWQPRLEAIIGAWSEIEWRSIAAGVRACAVRMPGPSEFVSEGQRWAEAGLSGLPIEMIGETSGYSAATPQAVLGAPFRFRTVVGSPGDLVTFKRAWDVGDQEVIGTMLGYPPCCREFFRDVWVELGMIDTTWPMAAATGDAKVEAGTIDVSGPPECNILWRWMGVRAVPHLPCRFDCEVTVGLAGQLIEVGRSAGFGQEMEWLLEILSWPVEWSALHGIAEIKTPILKVSASTDATPRTYVVRRHGQAIPREGARGLAFPYRRSRRPFSSSASFARGLSRAPEGPDVETRAATEEPPRTSAVRAPRAARATHNAAPKVDSGDGRAPAASAPLEIVQDAGKTPEHPDWYATDNGFSTVAAMVAQHKPILDLASAILGPAGGHVLDLGCGNGALLLELQALRPTVTPHGVDLDPVHIEHARTLHPNHADNFRVVDMFDGSALDGPEDGYALTFLMPGRLLETDRSRATQFTNNLYTKCPNVLAYAYGDLLDRRGSVATLAQRAGLSVVQISPAVSLVRI